MTISFSSRSNIVATWSRDVSCFLLHMILFTLIRMELERKRIMNKRYFNDDNEQLNEYLKFNKRIKRFINKYKLF